MRARTVGPVLFALVAAFACGASHTEEASPATCDGKWAIRVSNRVRETIEVHDSDRGVLLGTVPPGGERVFYALGSDRPAFKVTRIGGRGMYYEYRNQVDVQRYCEH
jgi:hypothetical protein